jgi:hypothetical protein
VKIDHPRDFVFQTLLDSFSAAGPLLEADRRAAEGRVEYDDAYFAQFFTAARPTLERRISEAIAGVASMIVSAWEQAGRPDLDELPRQPRRIRIPRE